MEPEPARIGAAAATPTTGSTKPTPSDGKPDEKKPVDESQLIVEELLSMLRAQNHLPAPWRRYTGERRKKFEEYTSRMVWFVDEEYLTITGKEQVKTKRTDIAYMLLVMRMPIFFDELKNAKAVAGLLIDGSVMLSTSDGRHFWDGKRVPESAQPGGQRFFLHFSDNKIVKRSTKEFDEAMKEAKVVMLAYDTPMNDYVCKYKHVVGGLKWEIQPHQMKEYANRRKVPPPPPQVNNPVAASGVPGENISTAIPSANPVSSVPVAHRTHPSK